MQKHTEQVCVPLAPFPSTFPFLLFLSPSRSLLPLLYSYHTPLILLRFLFNSVLVQMPWQSRTPPLNSSPVPPDAIPQSLPTWAFITIAVGGSVVTVIAVILTVAICCYCRGKYQNGDKFYAGPREYFNFFLFPFHAPSSSLSFSFPILLSLPFNLYFPFHPSRNMISAVFPQRSLLMRRNSIQIMKCKMLSSLKIADIHSSNYYMSTTPVTICMQAFCIHLQNTTQKSV